MQNAIKSSYEIRPESSLQSNVDPCIVLYLTAYPWVVIGGDVPLYQKTGVVYC